MSGGTNFALTTSSPSPAADRYVNGTLHTTLPEISTDSPDPGGGALPGDGSYGDPITGFRQINQQMADTQRAFSDATAHRSNEINAGFAAQNAARNADQRAQLNETAALSQALRAPLNQPPVTGPMLPPNFAETAQAPAMPAPGAMPAADTKAAQLALTTLAPPAQTTAPPAAEPSWLERGWSGVTGAASAAAGAIGQFDRDYGNILTRGAGAVQAVGGVGEAVLGGSLVGLGGAASATGAGAAPGLPAMIGGGALFANGLDNAQAGLRTVVTGQFQDTLAAEAAGGLAQAAGGSPEQAEAARFGANLASGALSLGGGIAAGMRVHAVGRQGAGEAERVAGSARMNNPLFTADPRQTQPSSHEFFDAVANRRDIHVAQPGSDDLKFLDMTQADASAGGPGNRSIIVRSDAPQRLTLLEEFLHGTQSKIFGDPRLGGTDRAFREWHVRDFMSRHSTMLGLDAQEQAVLIEERAYWGAQIGR